MDITDLARATWRKSSYSNGVGGECVEVGDLPGAKTALRDSKNPDGGVIVVGDQAWTTFVAGVKAGRVG
jgi:hypothetical protein